MRWFAGLTNTIRSNSSTSVTQTVYFNPSYRSLSRPNLTLQTSEKGKGRVDTCRFSSCGAGGSSSSSKTGGGRSKSSSSASSNNNTSRTTAKPSSLPLSTPGTTVTKPLQLLAPALPHASPSLISLDAFFALDRPLLELPIRLSARKSTQSSTPTLSPLETALEDVSTEEIQAMEVVDMEELGIDQEELVEVVDLAEDGTPIGPAYITTMSASAKKYLAETNHLQAELDAAEVALQELEDGYSDPYDAWLISEPESSHGALPVAVSRYLASRSPFVPPSVPTCSISPLSSSSPRRPLSTSTAHSPTTLANLTYLRPFAAPTPTLSTPANASFVEHFANPFSPALAQAVADRFLAAASLSHRWQAQLDYAEASGEGMEVARRGYAGEGARSVTVGRQKRRGELRTWSAEEGWTNVNLVKSSEDIVGGSPFLPREVMEEWVDEDDASTSEAPSPAILEEMSRLFAQRRAWCDRVTDGPRLLVQKGLRIGMDSTKRKRKKKITKHKYKKRR